MADTLLRTPLADAHESLGARMVPFAGWLMPLQYAGVVAEHLHTRGSASLFDLSHMGRLRVSGPDAASLLQQVTTNDVERLDVGAAQYSLMCNDAGGVVEDLLVYRMPDCWRLVVNAVNRSRVIGILDSTRQRKSLDAVVEDDTLHLALVGLQGPVAEEVLRPLLRADPAGLDYYHARLDTLTFFSPEQRRAERRQATEPPPSGRDERRQEDRRQAARGYQRVPCIVSRTGYTGEDGFEIALAADQAGVVWNRLLVDERVRPAGLGARDTLRLEAGMALYGHELTEAINPYEAGLGRVVRLDKGAFTGRNALAGLRERGPGRKLVGLTCGAGAVPRAGCTVRSAGEDVGEVTTGTFSPTLHHPVATAYVRADCATPDAELEVIVRDSPVAARLTPLPFVPHRTRTRLSFRAEGDESVPPRGADPSLRSG